MRVLVLVLVAAVLGAADDPKVDPADRFTWGERIVHPFALKKFDCWLSDPEPPAAAVVLQASLNDTNEYSDPVERRQVDGREGTLRIVDGDGKAERSAYGYRVVGRLENGIHVVETLDGTKRTTFHELKLLELGELPVQVGKDSRQ